MHKNTFRAALAAVLILAAGLLHASESPVPVVYEDEFITIHAGVPAIGARPLHIGDRISLVFRLEFDPRRLKPQLLDGDFFSRSFTEQQSVMLVDEPTLAQRDLGTRREVHVSWPFQILGCPGAATSCPGARSYELPTLSLAYQLLDESGKTLNHKAARFRPWPGRIEIAPALVTSATEAGFSAYFPAGAYPQAASTGMGRGTSWLAALLGFGLLAIGFLNSSSRRPAVVSPKGNAGPPLRWQSALAAASGAALGDEERSDLLRRSITWYCLDELGRNPCHWLREGGGYSGPADSGARPVRELFLDVLQRDRIDGKELDGYLRRFAEVSGVPLGGAGREKTA